MASDGNIGVFPGSPMPQVTIKRSKLQQSPQSSAQLQDALEQAVAASAQTAAQARVHRVEASPASQALNPTVVASEPAATAPAIQHGLRAAKRAVRKPHLIRTETHVPELPADVAERVNRWDFFGAGEQKQYEQLSARASELRHQIEEARRAPTYPDFLVRSKP